MGHFYFNTVASIIVSLGMCYFALRITEKNNQFKILEEKKEKNTFRCYLFSSVVIFVPFFSESLLYLEITFWYKLDLYLSKFLWNLVVLNYTISVLKAL